MLNCGFFSSYKFLNLRSLSIQDDHEVLSFNGKFRAYCLINYKLELRVCSIGFVMFLFKCRVSEKLILIDGNSQTKGF